MADPGGGVSTATKFMSEGRSFAQKTEIFGRLHLVTLGLEDVVGAMDLLREVFNPFA